MKRDQEIKLATLSPFEVKNALVTLAQSKGEKVMLDAGRGNPNWVATEPRFGFFQLGLFAMSEAQRTFAGVDGFGGHAEKSRIEDRFRDFLARNTGVEGISFLQEAFAYAVNSLEIDAEELLLEWTNGVLGGHYPEPDRMLRYCEVIVKAYLMQELFAGCGLESAKLDLFAVEGGTAAMTYIFETLRVNGILVKGDKIAIGTPIFTPYLEIPDLEEFDLVKVEITAGEDASWQISEAELNKLLDREVKAFFVVNPSNPPSARMNHAVMQKLAQIINEKRQDLILLTDDVYGTFVDNFVSLGGVLPFNTICVYSFSKYFGVTGWRLGVISMYQDNVIDRRLQLQSRSGRNASKNRYASVSLNPEKMKVLDRMVADSRTVALNHTAGLSTPQQIQMALLALYSLLDHTLHQDVYKKNAQDIVRRRYRSLYAKDDFKPLVAVDDTDNTFYYTEINLLHVAKGKFGDDFARWLTVHYEPLDYLIRLAQYKGVVLMPGGGFNAPQWSVRVSLANLPDEAYGVIYMKMTELLGEYHTVYSQSRIER